MIVCFFSFAEVRSGRMSSYDPRGWGHLPKSYLLLLPPSNLAGMCPPWLRCLGSWLSFGSFCQDGWHHVELILEWNGCLLSYDCFSVHLATKCMSGTAHVDWISPTFSIIISCNFTFLQYDKPIKCGLSSGRRLNTCGAPPTWIESRLLFCRVVACVGRYHAPLPIPATMDWGNRRSQWNGGTGSRGRLH